MPVSSPMYELLNLFLIMLFSLLSLIQLILLHIRPIVTFRRYHKIDLDSFHKDLGNCAFIRHPTDTVSVLCEQTI